MLNEKNQHPKKEADQTKILKNIRFYISKGAVTFPFSIELGQHNNSVTFGGAGADPPNIFETHLSVTCIGKHLR